MLRGVYFAASVCHLDNAVAFSYRDGRVIDKRRGTIRNLVERESVLVVFGKVERVACKGRGKGSTDHIREWALGSGRKGLFDEVEDAVSVTRKNDLVVIDPVHVAFVETFSRNNLEILAV